MLSDIQLSDCEQWEHAYYLKHTNKRAGFVAEWWGLVNWHKVSCACKRKRLIADFKFPAIAHQAEERFAAAQ